MKGPWAFMPGVASVKEHLAGGKVKYSRMPTDSGYKEIECALDRHLVPPRQRSQCMQQSYLQLLLARQEDLVVFKKDMQEAFQKGAAEEFSDLDTEILPETDIDSVLSKAGAVAYKVVSDGEMIGGAIVVIEEETQRNHLDFLYVKHGTQGRGVGQFIWKELEKLYPETRAWETITPYFEKRNIHFYVNRCGFHIVEFYNPKHKDPHAPDDMAGGDYFFRLEKKIKQST